MLTTYCPMVKSMNHSKRRNSSFVRGIVVLASLWMTFEAHVAADEATRPLPNARQLAWQEAEFGVVFHYDLHVFDGKKYGQGGNRITPIADYNIFNPKHLDTDQWICAARDAGARFAILTATHETGFALYQSDVNPYCLKAVKWRNGKGDIVREFVHSCRKYGLKPGIYVGIRWNSFLGVHDFQVNGEGPFRDHRQAYYRAMCEGMVRELCTRYGELFEIWFDGGASHPDKGAPDVLPIVKRHQPNCLFYHNEQLAEARWGGSESGTVPYPCWATFPNFYSHGSDSPREHLRLLKTGDPNGAYWMPAMSDAPLRGYNGRHEWFWEPGDEAHIYPLENLVEMYTKSVGRNSTLILGLTPDPNGLMPAPDVARLKEFGAEIRRRFDKPIATLDSVGWASAHADENDQGPHGLKPILLLDLKQPTQINHAVLMEDIRQGERVRAYVLEGLSAGSWIALAKGTCIGHKRIEHFEDATVTRVRLRVTQAVAEPIIRNLSVFQVE